jgi:hypothetical protein
MGSMAAPRWRGHPYFNFVTCLLTRVHCAAPSPPWVRWPVQGTHRGAQHALVLALGRRFKYSSTLVAARPSRHRAAAYAVYTIYARRSD